MTNEQWDKQIQKLEQTHYVHHTSAAKGYISRVYHVSGDIEEYNGKFGKGFKVHSPRWDTTQYHYVTYYIEKEHVND